MATHRCACVRGGIEREGEFGLIAEVGEQLRGQLIISRLLAFASAVGRDLSSKKGEGMGESVACDAVCVFAWTNRDAGI